MDTGDVEQAEEIKEATPNRCYSVDSVLVKKYHQPKVPLKHSAWFHVGVWPVNGNAILFYIFIYLPLCFRLYRSKTKREMMGLYCKFPTLSMGKWKAKQRAETFI